MKAPVAWWIAGNELRRLATDRSFLLFGLGLPVVIMALVGLTFGTQGSIDIGVLDEDGSPAAAAIVERLDALDGVDVKHFDSERELRREVRTTALEAGLAVRDGYGEAVARGEGSVELVVDPSTENVASAISAIRGAAAAQGVEAGAAGLVATELGDPELARRAVADAAEGLAPVGVREIRTGVDRSVDIGSFSYTAPSNLVLFVFINTFVVSSLLASDRRYGLIQRVLATPNRPRSVLAGIGASKLLFSLGQSLLILCVGALGFGVEWGNPVGALLLVLAFATLSTTIGLYVGAIVSDAEQAQAVGIPIAVAMGMLGGCMWPLDIVPDVMRISGHVVPQAWAMDAWRVLIFEDGGVRDILPELGILVAATLVLAPLTVRRLQRSLLG